MQINPYITRGINETLTKIFPNLTLEYGKERTINLIQITYTFLDYNKCTDSQSHMNKNNPHINWNITI